MQLATIVAALERFEIPVDRCDDYKEYLANL